MFSNSPGMTKMDRNISELQQIVCEEHNFNICAFVGYCVNFIQLVSPNIQ